ncbi:MAG: polysulfide reductase NrfD, partial [Deltaproteobacteria bacterium]|nr:polysulfide reductase NrfD [Deltaproteobacteria bacterium]
MPPPKNCLWPGLIGLGIVAGLITAVRVFISDGMVVYAKTDILVWTLPLASYVFFSLTSSGIAFASSIPAILGIKRFEPLEKRTAFLEISVLLAALSCLMLHLGSPWNAIYFLLSPNPASPLWWLGMLYGLYLVILLLSFLYTYRTQRMSRALGLLVFLIASTTVIMLAWLFSMTPARPIFSFPFLAAYFPLSALACGFAAVML